MGWTGTARTRLRGFTALFGVLGCLVALLASGTAQAAEPEGAELRQVVETALPRPNFAPSYVAGLRWDRDTQWTVMTLAEPSLTLGELRDSEGPRLLGPLTGLGRFDLRDDAWQPTPYAATTLASAFAAIATRGIPVMREVRDYKLVRTHRLGCYFKGRGGGLVWRLEF